MKDKTKAVGAALELATQKTTTEAAAGSEPLPSWSDLPFYPIDLDGKSYKLCFDLRELAKAEQELRREGHGVDLLLALNVGALNLDAVETLFAATVRTFHPELKYDDAVALVTLSSVYHIATVILEALVVENRGGAGKSIEGGGGEVKGERPQPNRRQRK